MTPGLGWGGVGQAEEPQPSAAELGGVGPLSAIPSALPSLQLAWQWASCLEEADENSAPASQAPYHRVLGRARGQGSGTKTRLYEGILALGSMEKPWGFKADTEEAGQGLRIETETFLLPFFLQYKTTVENNFS